jgi:hypothetical protein
MQNWRKMVFIALNVFAATIILITIQGISKIFLLSWDIYLSLLLGSLLAIILCTSIPPWQAVRKLRENALKKIIEKFPEKYIHKDRLYDLKCILKEIAWDYYEIKQSSKYLLELLQDIDSVNVFC